LNGHVLAFHKLLNKILKASPYKIGITIWGHSLTEILKITSNKIEINEDIFFKAKLLDLYYIPTRHPNRFYFR